MIHLMNVMLAGCRKNPGRTSYWAAERRGGGIGGDTPFELQIFAAFSCILCDYPDFVVSEGPRRTCGGGRVFAQCGEAW